MSSMLAQLRTVVEELTRIDVEWALVGALAVSVYTEPRTTRDIDVAILIKNEEERKRIVELLVQRGFSNPTLLMHVEPTFKLGTRLQTPATTGTPVALDLLHSSSGIEPEIVAAAISIEFLPGIILPVASIGHLIAMKLIAENETDRLKDRDDLQKLLAVASTEDLKQAQLAADLVKARGFARGKDLSLNLAHFTAAKQS